VTFIVFVHNPRTKFCFFPIYPFILASILALIIFLLEPSFGAAQHLVRVRSETRIELSILETSRAAKLTGTLRDSLGIPLPNQKIDVSATSLTDRKSRTVVTTGSKGEFTMPIAIKRRSYGVSARFDGNEFYEATETTLDTSGFDSSARRQFTSPENAATALGSYLDERRKKDSEPMSVFWLFIPMFLCLGVVVAIRRRLRNTKTKFEYDNEASLNPGIEISLPVRYARKDQTSISGTIRDLHSGEAVPHVELTIARERDTSIALDITSEGFFSSPSLKPGKWQIQAQAKGYVETIKEFYVPHRGEWTNVRIHLLSMRSLALQSYRKVALAILPTPQLWDIWTARETLHNSRRLLGSLSLFRSLIERVERSSYDRTPPSNEEVKIIETQASSALIAISQSESDYTVTHRR
jgi:hypothetical protein